MKLKLKLISLIFSLGVFSLPVKSQVCPTGSTNCGGTCCIGACGCLQKVALFQGNPEFIYILPEGTSYYYCENGQTPKSPSSGIEAPTYFVCSLETSSLIAALRKPTPFTPQADTTYSLGENTAFQCKTGAPIQKGNLWSCPSKTSK